MDADQPRLTHEDFIEKLLDLLVIIEGGMKTLLDPLPEDVEKHIADAIFIFGEKALPALHATRIVDMDRMNHPKEHKNSGRIIDILGEISSPDSAPLLIDFHRSGPISFMTSAAALGALRKIGTDEAYEYLGRVLTQYAGGNTQVIESSLDLRVACRALKEWEDERAIPPLKAACHIEGSYEMPDTAIIALASYQQAHEYLKDLAKTKPSLSELIEQALKDSD